MAILAIIPARGGSKRIPRKNIKNFLGKPIIAYSIQAALDSGVFDEVMVSTDDEEIAEIARQYGAKVPFMRSEFAASDTAVDKDVLFEVLGEYQKRGQNFDYLVEIYPCAPFVTPQKLRDMVKMLQENDIDSVLPVCIYSNAPQRSLVMRDGKLKRLYPQYEHARSQDMESIYYECGQCWGLNVKKYLNNPDDLEHLPFLIPEGDFQDVDTVEDWELAEFKYQYMQSKGKV